MYKLTLRQSTVVAELKRPIELGPPQQFSTVLWALLIAALFHLGLYFFLPDRLLQPALIAELAPQEVQVTILPPQVIDPAELRFVEANPEAAENIPDEKDQYSFRNQQSASETLTEGPLNAPNVAGDSDSQKIIQGRLERSPPLAAGLYAAQTGPGAGEGTEGGDPRDTLSAVVELNPSPPLAAPDFIQQKPILDVGPGSRLVEPGLAQEVFAEADALAAVEIYRRRPTEVVDAATRQRPANDASAQAKPMPRARPRLAAELLTGPLMQSQGSARLRGTLAIDATFSEFGEYQQQFFAAIQAGWYQEIEFFQPIDTATRVVVQFTLQADGAVSDVSVLQSNASQIASVLCESAISKRSPFRVWSPDMVRVFGQSRTLTVAFHYR